MVCHQTQIAESVQGKDRVAKGRDFNSPDICQKFQLDNSRISNRSLTCFANSFISQWRHFPGGAAILHSFLANQKELGGILTVLSNLGVRYHITSEFRRGCEGDNSLTYHNLCNCIPNQLEMLGMISLEGKSYQLLKFHFKMCSARGSKGESKRGGIQEFCRIPVTILMVKDSHGMSQF